MSKILFALSLLSLIITAIYQVMEWIKYKNELKAYKIIQSKVELQRAREARIAKEAEVIRLFNEMQRQTREREGEEVVSIK